MYICINKDLVVVHPNNTHTTRITKNKKFFTFLDYRMANARCAYCSLLDMSLDLTSQKMSAILAWDVNMTVAYKPVCVRVSVAMSLCLPSRVHLLKAVSKRKMCQHIKLHSK